MPRLVLVRHAKAQHMNPRGDHERELAERGVADAKALGQWLLEQGQTAQLALSSTAVRAQQTLQALEEVTGPTETWTDKRIYNGGVSGVAAAIGEAPESVEVLWVVGHEPVLSTAVWELSDEQRMPDALHAQLASGFPPATAAVLELDEGWDTLSVDGARLLALHTGRATG